jgi:hypothetical protein
MNIKKLAGTAAIAAGVGAAGLGLGAGSAQADDHWRPFPWPEVPGQGPAGMGAPGQLKKVCVDGRYFDLGPCGTPPGHWQNGPQGPPPIYPWER